MKEGSTFLESTKFNLQLAGFRISSAGCPELINMKNVRVVSKLDVKRQDFNLVKIKTAYQLLKGIGFPSPNPNDITLLIGTGISNFPVNFVFRCGRYHEPYAVGTKLGYALMAGRTLKGKSLNENRNEILPGTERFWQIESYEALSKTDPIVMTKDKKRTASTRESTTTVKDGRCEMRLLWREDIGNVPYSRNLGVKRLEAIESKLSKIRN